MTKRGSRGDPMTNPVPEAEPAEYAEPSPTNNVTIFMQTGHTFTFKNVDIETDNENVLAFSYIAMSDGRMKKVNFSKFIIAGHSVYLS